MPQRIEASGFALIVPMDEPFGDAIKDQVTAALPGLSFVALSDIAEIARLPKESSILLAVSSPVEALARKLLSLDDTEAALAEWKSATAALLTMTRKIRRRLWLVDARALALGDPATLDCFSTAQTGVPDVTMAEEPSPWLLLLAEALIERDADAQRMAGEVAAMRRGAGGLHVTTPVCQAAFKGLSVLTTERDLLRDQVALQTEDAERRAGVEAELKAATDEIARLKSEAKAAKKSLAERSAEIERLKAVEGHLDRLLAALAKEQGDGSAAKGKPGIDEAVNLLASLQTERTLLREHIQLQLEAAEKASSELTTAKSAAADEIARLKSEAKADRKSLAERSAEIERLKAVEDHLDRLLAALANVQGDGSAAKEKPGVEEAVNLLASIQTERTLLREHIQLQLEAAEKASSELTTAKGAAADRNLQKAKAEALQRRLDDMVAKMAAREALLGEALLRDQKIINSDRTEEERLRAEALEAELHRVYASKSWKVTGPLRAMLSIGKR
jgi:archaellum component FlaC